MERAKEYLKALNDVTKYDQQGHLDGETKNQLESALYPLAGVSAFLVFLSDNEEIRAQIRPLFIEACDGIPQILSHIEDQGLTSGTIGVMSELVQQKFKPEIILERINASKPSITPSIITMEMVKPIHSLLDAVAELYDRKRHSERDNTTRDALESRVKFASCFLWFTANQCIEHEKMKDLFAHAVDVAYTAADLAFLNLHSKLEEDQASTFLGRTSPFSPEFRQIYLSVLIWLKSAEGETGDMLYLYWALQMLVKELLSRKGSLKEAFGDSICWLETGLLRATKYYKQMKEEKVFKDLVSCNSHEKALAIEAGMLIYSLFDEEMDNYHVLIPLLAKLNHVALYMEVIELLTKTWNPVTGPLKDLGLYFKEELIFLRTFLMFSLEQSTEQTKLTEVLTLLQSLTTEAWSAIDSFQWKSDQESLALEISLVQFHLLFKFNFIKAVVRQIRPAISASSEPAHPMINLLNFLPASFEVIDSYFNELKTLKTSSSSSGSPTMDDVLLGFHEYVFNLLLRAHLKFADTDELKRFHHGLLVTILFYEGALDSNTSRKVNLMLWLLTMTTKLFKSEDNLMDILNQKATWEAQILDLVESAHEELILLREFLIHILRQHRECDKFDDVFMRAEVAANKASLISISSYESFIDGSSMGRISDFLLEIESVKVPLRQVCIQILDASLCNTSLIDVEGLINFLLNHPDRVLERDAGSINFLKKQIPVIKEKLVLLSPFYADMVRHHDMHQELLDLVKCIQDAAAGAKYVFFFSIRGDRPAWYDMLYLSDVKQLIRFVEEQVRLIIPGVPDSSSYSFPRIGGLGFLDSLLGKLEELLCSNLDYIIDLNHQIGSINDGLLCLRDQFVGVCDAHGEVFGLVTSVTEMAYKVEFVIDSCLVNSYPLWYKDLWISKVIENIKLLTKVVTGTCDKKEIGVTVQKVAKTSTNLRKSLSANTSVANEEMEGFQEATEKIKQQLLRGSSQLDVISIVGMAGVGKTTLAEKVFNELIATRHFDVHAKCRVTQVYSQRELLLTILNDLLGHVDRTEKDDGELADELRRFLFTKRFLVLIDDVWENDVWENLNMCFTGSPRGSRIILTTRLINIASNAKCGSDPHHLRLFKDNESWTLLQDQVFQGKKCPPELEDVGIRIAKSCGGLPLFIVLVAGVLKKKKKKNLWEEVEERLARQNLSSLEESMPIIGFSYKNLPDDLKPCFLYFGGLLKGKDIHVSKLTQLWMSEGFVQAPEDDAQYFLDDLISRNLVMVVKKRPNGEVKMCRIHDMLHQFCFEKAKQENLFLQINRFSQEDAFPENLEEYRLFVHSSQDDIDQWQPSRSNTRSLIFNDIALDSLSLPSDISFIFDSFKLVKVLDLESLNIGGTFPYEVQYLVHLRYFATQTDANSIPSSIAKLWNLETFVVRGLGGEVILPSSILKMVKLRHLLVKHRASFNLHENMGESLANSQLDNLKTFSSLRLSYGKDSETILRKMPHLRKLSCIISGTFGYSEKVEGRCVLFPKLEFLSHLESLKLVSNSSRAKLQHVFNFPSNLRELTLSKFRLPWSQISTVGELPNLEILKLALRAFEGKHWEVDDSEFPELKYLELNNLNIEEWSVSEDAFGKLDRLVLTKCEKLKEIPSQFGDSGSLQSIDISWCSSSAAESAQQIQETQHENSGRNTFTISVQSSS